MKTIEDSFLDWHGHVFPFGYGTGEEHTLPILREFFENLPKEETYNYKQIEECMGAPVAWLMLNLMCQHQMIEYGSSPRFGWLTKAGKAMKVFLAERSVEQLVEIVCNYDEDSVTWCEPDVCNCGSNGYEEGRHCANPFWDK